MQLSSFTMSSFRYRNAGLAPLIMVLAIGSTVRTVSSEIDFSISGLSSPSTPSTVSSATQRPFRRSPQASGDGSSYNMIEYLDDIGTEEERAGQGFTIDIVDLQQEDIETVDDSPLIPQAELVRMEAGEPWVTRQHLDMGKAGSAEPRCFKESVLLGLNPPFDFRNPAYWPRGYDPNAYTNFREVCVKGRLLPNAGCKCTRDWLPWSKKFIEVSCIQPRNNHDIFEKFAGLCGMYCGCKSHSSDILKDLIEKFPPPRRDREDSDDEDDRENQRKIDRNPRGKNIVTGLKSVLEKAQKFAQKWTPRGRSLEGSQPIYVPINPEDLQEIQLAELVEEQTCAAGDSCEASMTSASSIADSAVTCGLTCDGNQGCSTGCVCKADAGFLTAKAKGLDWNFPPAVCVALSLSVLRTKQHHRPGFTGLLPRGEENGDLSPEQVRERELLSRACVCNSTYISRGCCDAPDGMIWEDRGLKLGSLEYEL